MKFYVICSVHCDIITKVRQTKCTSVKFSVIFHNVVYTYSFESEGFRKTVVTNTGTV